MNGATSRTEQEAATESAPDDGYALTDSISLKMLTSNPEEVISHDASAHGHPCIVRAGLGL
jgi:hypothetical protein